LPRDITAPSTNNQLVSIIYLSPVANLFLKFRINKISLIVTQKIKAEKTIFSAFTKNNNENNC
ncbi:hypothetical protein, partial [Limosilactobacillus reuteri]|uniref:hypothetical protein n=1 Tax=Limosilactobacillus reuteri TaxID=1598 RepID=UPI001E30245E